MSGSFDSGLGSAFESRRKIHPKRVSGYYRRLKWLVLFVTLGIYYVTPWLRWGRGEGAPDQAVLIDLYHRKFYFFFIEIWPQEFFLVAGLLIMAGLGLFLLTSLAGRVWCGFTCPQTVWVDLFIFVERFIEGDRNARSRLDSQGWSINKLIKRVSKHGLWVFIAMATGGAWILYFADAPSLFISMFRGESVYQAYVAFGVMTGLTYFLAGFMREQVCIYMCPWPRIQSALLDEGSVVVTYRGYRGEPRLKGHMGGGREGYGDCVDCDLCVAVCPMGIDIRDGLQLGCINCGLCIDACNGVMERLGRARDWLIGYDTGANNVVRSEGRLGDIEWPWFKFRNILYFCMWGCIGVGMVIYLGLRDLTDVGIVQERNPVVVRLSDGSYRNSYDISIINRESYVRSFDLLVDRLDMRVEYRGVGGNHELFSGIDVGGDSLRKFRVFVIFSPGVGADFGDVFPIDFVLVDGVGERRLYGSVFTVR